MNRKWKILVSAPYMQKELYRFINIFEKFNLEITVPNVEERMEECELLNIIDKFDGVICGDDRFTEAVYKKAVKLKVISKWGTGIDSIDQTLNKKYGIIICNTPDAFSHPVSDTVLALILEFSRNISRSDQVMKNGDWTKITGKTLSEQTLGIIGLGNVGTQVAKRASAFNMNIIVNDIRTVPSVICEQYNIKLVSKDELYKSSDFISINCDLNDSSYHLLSLNEFKKMKKKPIIINTARGPIINEKDLIEALNKNFIRGAGLDVFEFEPLPNDSPLRKMDNVRLSSHNSNSSPKYWDKVHINTINNLLSVLNKDQKQWINSIN